MGGGCLFDDLERTAVHEVGDGDVEFVVLCLAMGINDVSVVVLVPIDLTFVGGRVEETDVVVNLAAVAYGPVVVLVGKGRGIECREVELVDVVG